MKARDGAIPALAAALLAGAVGLLGLVWHLVKKEPEQEVVVEGPLLPDPEPEDAPFASAHVRPDGRAFVMVLAAPWKWAEGHEARLRDRIDRTRAYILTQLEETHPESRGIPLRLRIECRHRPTDAALAVLRASRIGAEKEDIEIEAFLVHPDGSSERIRLAD